MHPSMATHLQHFVDLFLLLFLAPPCWNCLLRYWTTSPAGPHSSVLGAPCLSPVARSPRPTCCTPPLSTSSWSARAATSSSHHASSQPCKPGHASWP
ncbi:hypothetical protein V8C86DRAFT_124166 [Haematococcus lacustris]